MAKKLKRWQREALDWPSAMATLGVYPNFRRGMSIDDQIAVARARVRWQRQLRDLVETHRRRSRMSDTDRLQELHNPTVEIATDDPEATRKTRRNLTRCRQSEAWRHNRLSGMQRDAEREMEFAFRQRTVGLGAAVSRMDQLRNGQNRLDLGVGLDQAWRDWCKLTRSRHIKRNAVIDCLTEPKSLAQVERDHRIARGHAFENYVRGLDLWCEVRGWVNTARRPYLVAPTVSAA